MKISCYVNLLVCQLYDHTDIGKCPKNSTSPPRCHSDQVDSLVFIRNLNFGWALMFLSRSLISVLECSYQSYGLLCAPCAICSHSNRHQMTPDLHCNLDFLYTITNKNHTKKDPRRTLITKWDCIECCVHIGGCKNDHGLFLSKRGGMMKCSIRTISNNSFRFYFWNNVVNKWNLLSTPKCVILILLIDKVCHNISKLHTN